MMFGLIGLLLLILLRVVSRTLTVADSQRPGIAPEVMNTTPNAQTGEADDADGSEKLAA
jgi:hypothetical protein